MPFLWFKTCAYIISFLIYHIYFPYFLSFAYIVYLIYFILFLISCSLQVSYTFMFISCHVDILCMYHILSYLIYFHITYLILSYTFIYILILFIYGTFVCFHLVLFMYCTFICFHTYNLHMLMQSYTFLSYHVSFRSFTFFFLFLSTYTCHYLHIVSHSNAMLLISCHVLLSFSNHVHILFICFMFHACINLRSG